MRLWGFFRFVVASNSFFPDRHLLWELLRASVGLVYCVCLQALWLSLPTLYVHVSFDFHMEAAPIICICGTFTEVRERFREEIHIKLQLCPKALADQPFA